jgi:hypothetical protein
MASILDLLQKLSTSNVDFVLVGGMATAAHGCSLVTEDVDVAVRFNLETVTQLSAALVGLDPRLRMVPQRPPLPAAASLVGWKNLYVTTSLGQVDFLGQVTGVGDYATVRANAVDFDMGTFNCRVMSIEDLIRSKRAMGRPKDLRAVVELERILKAKKST